jgi:hypothetical protein
MRKQPKPYKPCLRCKVMVRTKDMLLKMGGLLCPHCRRILCQPGIDREFYEEYSKRRLED